MNTILLRLGSTPANSALILKKWIDEVAIKVGIPSQCFTYTLPTPGTRRYGKFDSMLGWQCINFESYLCGECGAHLRELYLNNLTWGTWEKTIVGGPGGCTTRTLNVGMFI